MHRLLLLFDIFVTQLVQTVSFNPFCPWGKYLTHVDQYRPVVDPGGDASVCAMTIDQSRRQLLSTTFVLSFSAQAIDLSPWKTVNDPKTYSALAYAPKTDDGTQPPLILFLHGAGKNEQDISNLANPNGEHAGLLPSLLVTGMAPKELTENFAILAPYSFGKRSFYEEPRGKILSFLDWASSAAGREAGYPSFDPNRIFLFGFSDGATLGVELMTTKRFAGGVFAAYGFTGELPDLALERLKGLPVWIFHSADDVIFPVSCSDKLVLSLKQVNQRKDLIRYTRFEQDPEGFTGSVRGHSTGITASKDPEVYKWLLSL
jgi:predicted peptidase